MIWGYPHRRTPPYDSMILINGDQWNPSPAGHQWTWRTWRTWRTVVQTVESHPRFIWDTPTPKAPKDVLLFLTTPQLLVIYIYGYRWLRCCNWCWWSPSPHINHYGLILWQEPIASGIAVEDEGWRAGDWLHAFFLCVCVCVFQEYRLKQLWQNCMMDYSYELVNMVCCGICTWTNPLANGQACKL